MVDSRGKNLIYPHYDDVWRLLPFNHWFRKELAETATVASQNTALRTLGPYKVNSDNDEIIRHGRSNESQVAAGVPDARQSKHEHGWLSVGPVLKFCPWFPLARQAVYCSAHVI